jgi:hypothetical protein
VSTSLSTYLNLVKPVPGTKEPWNQVTENANTDKLDSAIGPKYTNTSNPTVNTSTSENQMFGATILPASQQSVWRIVAWGSHGSTATPTLTIRAKLGGVQIGAIVISPAAGSGRMWRAEAEVVCMTTGVSGTWSGILSLQYNDGSGQKSAVDGVNPTLT